MVIDDEKIKHTAIENTKCDTGKHLRFNTKKKRYRLKCDTAQVISTKIQQHAIHVLQSFVLVPPKDFR